MENNYPLKLITGIIKQRLHKFYNNNNNTKHNQKNSNYISLPFIDGLSQQLGKKFKHYNITLAHKNSNNLKFLFSNLKYKTPIQKQSNIIYQIPCNDCDKVYIGQTSQYLKERINGHKYQKNNTALKKHANENKHKFNFDNTTILHKITSNKARNILESIYIKNNKHACNNKTDIVNLPKIYYPIIKKFD